MVIIGIISLSVNFLDPIWGSLLIAAGIPFFFIKKRFLFVIFGITILLAGLANIVVGIAESTYGWAVFGIIQLYLSIQEIRKYFKYAAATSDVCEAKKHDTAKPEEQSHSPFGIASFTLSLLAGALILLIFTGSIITIFVSGNIEENPTVNVIGWSVLLSAALSFIALVLGIVGILHKQRKKVFSVLGTIFSLILISGITFFMVFG